MSSARSWSCGAVVMVLVAFGSLAACAEGSTGELGTGASNNPTEPSERDSSASLPPPSNGEEGENEKDSGKKDSGTTDSGTDATTGIDAGNCATVPPSNLCGLAPQCGCASNETCDVTNHASGATSCILAGGGPQASLCTTSNQCQKGLTCIYGTCRPYCSTPNTACTGAGLGKCAQLYSPTNPPQPYPNSKFCTINCSLRNPSAACGANTCIWDGDVDTTDCDVPGTKDIGDSCVSYSECRPGLNCGPGIIPGTGECQSWCRLGSNGDCGLFETCSDVFGAGGPTEGSTPLGLCRFSL